MLLFDLLKMWEPTFTPTTAKVHLARHNGEEHPLDVFLEGRFDRWQSWQAMTRFRSNGESSIAVPLLATWSDWWKYSNPASQP